MRLPRRNIDVLEDAARALVRGNCRIGLLQRDHRGVLLAAELRHVGLDGARADGEDDWLGNGELHERTSKARGDGREYEQKRRTGKERTKRKMQ